MEEAPSSAEKNEFALVPLGRSALASPQSDDPNSGKSQTGNESDDLANTLIVLFNSVAKSILFDLPL